MAKNENYFPIGSLTYMRSRPSFLWPTFLMTLGLDVVLLYAFMYLEHGAPLLLTMAVMLFSVSVLLYCIIHGRRYSIALVSTMVLSVFSVALSISTTIINLSLLVGRFN